MNPQVVSKFRASAICFKSAAFSAELAASHMQRAQLCACRRHPATNGRCWHCLGEELHVMRGGPWKVWLFVEKTRPVRWGLRVGGLWFTVGKVHVRCAMKSVTRHQQPRGALCAKARVIFNKDSALIYV
jgi:hypothetical protein